MAKAVGEGVTGALVVADTMGEGRGVRGAFQSVRGDKGAIDRVQNGAEGAVVRGPSATGI